MGICWYCYWGWPKAIRDIYNLALEKLDGYASPLHYGPANIVWEDENWQSAQWCIDHFDEYSENLSEREKSVVMWSLQELLKLPEHVLNAKPDDFDDEHPANFPPPSDIEWDQIWYISEMETSHIQIKKNMRFRPRLHPNVFGTSHILETLYAISNKE